MSFFGKLFATVHSVGEHVAQQVMASDPSPFERLAWLKSDPARLDALAVASQKLNFEERYTDSDFVLQHAAGIDPMGLIDRRIDLARMRQRPEDELALVRQAAEAFPKDTGRRSHLADLLLEFEAPAEALAVLDAAPSSDRILDTSRAAALAELGQLEEARRLAQELARYWEDAARGSLMEGESMDAVHQHNRCLGTLEHIAALETGHGILGAAASGRLDRHAHQNYTSIGLALKDEGIGASPDPLSLPDEYAAEDALKDAPRSAKALCDAGMVALRQGSFKTAQKHFRTAHELHVKHFPAALGLGAAMRLEETEAWRGLDALPELTPDRSLAAFVEDWEALTPEERRVVQASTEPLRPLWTQLAADGARLRILPLAGRFDDAVGDGTLGFIRIENLLDTTSQDGAWSLGYVVADMCFRKLPGHVTGELQALHRKATELEWAVGTWAQLDPSSLFATAYRGWLHRKYGRKWAPKRDSEGIVEALEALISRLAE